MLHLPSFALRRLVTNTAFVLRRDAAVVLRVVPGDVGAATDTWVVTVCTNVPAPIVTTEFSTIIIGTIAIVVTGGMTLSIGSV